MAVVVGTGVVLKGVKGDQGVQGVAGTAGTNGTNGTNGIDHVIKSGVPAASDGTGKVSGSSYQVLETGEIYLWNGTSWTDTGYTSRGSMIWNGSGAFSAANFPKAIAGQDYYFQTDTGTYYPLVNG